MFFCFNYYYVLFCKAPCAPFASCKVLHKNNLIDWLINKNTEYVSPNSAKAAGLRQSAG